MYPYLDHVKINVSNPDFYKEFLVYLVYKLKTEYSRGFGVNDGKTGVWVLKTPKDQVREINFKSSGLNHLAFRVGTKEAVDKFYKEYLLAKKIPVLHEPKEYNYAPGYYAVFFEDPTDHIKLEIIYEP